MRLFGLKCVWVDKWQYYLWKQQLENRKVIISFGNFNDLTNFMKQSHSWGANSSSLSQDIPLHFMEVESSLTPSQQPETSLSWARSIQSRSPAIVLLKIYFNIIIPLKSTPSKFFFFFPRRWNKGLIHFAGYQTATFLSPNSRSVAFGPAVNCRRSSRLSLISLMYLITNEITCLQAI